MKFAKTNWLFALILATFWLIAPNAASAQNSPQIVIDNADCVATDALGRKLPTYAEVGGPRPNRYVGLFYWLWHGPDRWGPEYNVTEFLKAHPGFRDFQAHPKGGPDFPTWYWAEPLFGYYRSTDPWVIRKHLTLLADAGVDFLFLDYTNGSVYDAELKQFLDVAEDLKAKGVHVPRLVFFLNSEPEWKIESLYRTWYKPGKYDDMWFRWQGKPLLMAARPTQTTKMKEPGLLPAIQEYFTWRPTWAFHDAGREPTKWRFMDEFFQGRSQRPALGPDGKLEQMAVSKSLGGPLWNNMKTGGVSCAPGHVPAYNDQWVSPDAAQGIFFQAQWDNAERVGAPILLVTGWNEWTASVWETPGVVFLGRTTQAGQGHIVDEFNQDFNRDLEPMRGGYGDDYYSQFVANMRRYKGMRAPEKPSAPRTIRLEEAYQQWASVRPVYHDPSGDTANRDWDGAVPHSHYRDDSARNDIVLAQVARDRANIYFHVRTAAPLSPAGDRNWMLLFLDTDADGATGWHGYDFLVNRRRTGLHCTIERNVGGAWNWKPVGEASFRRQGNDLMLAVPRRLLGLPAARGRLTLDFKWADNLPERPDIPDFYSHGDAAPDGRFNYRFAEPGRQAHSTDLWKAERDAVQHAEHTPGLAARFRESRRRTRHADPVEHQHTDVPCRLFLTRRRRAAPSGKFHFQHRQLPARALDSGHLPAGGAAAVLSVARRDLGLLLAEWRQPGAELGQPALCALLFRGDAVVVPVAPARRLVAAPRGRGAERHFLAAHRPDRRVLHAEPRAADHRVFLPGQGEICGDWRDDLDVSHLWQYAGAGSGAVRTRRHSCRLPVCPLRTSLG